MTNQSGSGNTTNVSSLVLQVLQSTLAVNFSGSSTTKWTDMVAPTQNITLATVGSRVLARIDGAMNIPSTVELLLALKVGATYFSLGGVISSSNRTLISGQVIASPATAGLVTVTIGYFVSTGTVNCRPVTFPDNEELRLTVMELAS